MSPYEFNMNSVSVHVCICYYCFLNKEIDSQVILVVRQSHETQRKSKYSTGYVRQNVVYIFIQYLYNYVMSTEGDGDESDRIQDLFGRLKQNWHRQTYKDRTKKGETYLHTVTHCSTVQLLQTTEQHQWKRQWQRSVLFWRTTL